MFLHKKYWNEYADKTFRNDSSALDILLSQLKSSWNVIYAEGWPHGKGFLQYWKEARWSLDLKRSASNSRKKASSSFCVIMYCSCWISFSILDLSSLFTLYNV